MIRRAQKDIDYIVVKESTIDVYNVPLCRVRSDPLFIQLDDNVKNKIDIRVRLDDASSEGYGAF